jgi:hypothetical protein
MIKIQILTGLIYLNGRYTKRSHEQAIEQNIQDTFCEFILHLIAIGSWREPLNYITLPRRSVLDR